MTASISGRNLCRGILVAPGVTFFDPGEGSEAFARLFQRLPELCGMLPGLFDLFVKLTQSIAFLLLFGQLAEFRVHFRVLVGFALDYQFEATRGIQFISREQQVHMAKGVLDFLRRCGLEDLGAYDIALGATEPGEVQLLDVCHGLPGKRRFQVFNCD